MTKGKVEPAIRSLFLEWAKEAAISSADYPSFS